MEEFISATYGVSDMAFGQMTNQFISDYEYFLIDGQGKKAATAHKYFTYLKQACHRAFKDGLTDKYLFARYKEPTIPKKSPRTITPENFQWIVSYPDVHGAESKTCAKRLSAERLNLIVINAVVPMLFAYGRSKGKEVYCDRAFDFIEQCKAENNAITKHWVQYGIKTETACDSQALIQLQREYCDKRQCLRCRFRYEFLRGRTKIEGYRNMAIEPDLFAELY